MRKSLGRYGLTGRQQVHVITLLNFCSQVRLLHMFQHLTIVVHFPGGGGGGGGGGGAKPYSFRCPFLQFVCDDKNILPTCVWDLQLCEA